MIWLPNAIAFSSVLLGKICLCQLQKQSFHWFPISLRTEPKLLSMIHDVSCDLPRLTSGGWTTGFGVLCIQRIFMLVSIYLNLCIFSNILSPEDGIETCQNNFMPLSSNPYITLNKCSYVFFVCIPCTHFLLSQWTLQQQMIHSYLVSC